MPNLTVTSLPTAKLDAMSDSVKRMVGLVSWVMPSMALRPVSAPGAKRISAIFCPLATTLSKFDNESKVSWFVMPAAAACAMSS